MADLNRKALMNRGYAFRLAILASEPAVKEFIARLSQRERALSKLQDQWLRSIVAQREKRDLKKYESTKTQERLIAEYGGDAEKLDDDLVARYAQQPDLEKLAFLLKAEVEALISEHAFWSELLSAAPKAAFRKIQKFRLATIDLFAQSPWHSGTKFSSEVARANEIQSFYEKPA